MAKGHWEELACTKCGGFEGYQCSSCSGKGTVAVPNHPEQMPCDNCGGKGYVTCSKCGGSGTERVWVADE